jgi:RsiW-degrading membrane proteinase PrsW (M82 family)
MADFAGLLTAMALLGVGAYFLPMNFSLKLAAIAVVALVNGILWHNNPKAQMPLWEALRTATITTAILVIVAIFDTGVGYLSGYRTIPDAFLYSGPLGGMADIFLAALGVFVGIPTLIRSVVMFYERRHT